MKIFVTKPFLPPMEEIVEQFERIWDSGILTNQGPLHNEFEQALQKYLQCANLTLFVNGHLALETAIRGLNLEGQVITTPFTFASTTHALTSSGIQPVFCDIKPSDFTMDEAQIEALITEQTSAIMPVHVYGYPCNVTAIEIIARRHKLKVVYDAAHAFGVEIGDMPIGNYGDVSMFSFHATKLFHTIEGGALVYGDSAYKKNFDRYKNFGITGPETVECVGINAKMNEFQAAMGLVNLRYQQRNIDIRQHITLLYRELLRDVEEVTFAQDIPGIKHNYAYFPVVIRSNKGNINRDTVFAALEEREIHARKYFYPLITDFDCYRSEYAGKEFPVAQSVAANVLTLPIYPGLSDEDIRRICDVIKSVL